MKDVLLGALCAASFATAAMATPISVSPTQDVFVYQGFPAFNWSTGDTGKILSSAADTSNATQSLIQFDLTGVHLDAGETATLNLFVVDGEPLGFPFANPTAAAPVPTAIYKVNSAWNESTANWNSTNSPPIFDSSTAYGAISIDSINHYVQFDITALVQQWLDVPSSNHGLLIVQTGAAVSHGEPVAVVYNSSSASSNTPFLLVPEPASIGLLGIAGLVGGRRRRH